jgi:hypothetical protein
MFQTFNKAQAEREQIHGRMAVVMAAAKQQREKPTKKSLISRPAAKSNRELVWSGSP